jgi:hypothetical protein
MPDNNILATSVFYEKSAFNSSSKEDTAVEIE